MDARLQKERRLLWTGFNFEIGSLPVGKRLRKYKLPVSFWVLKSSSPVKALRLVSHP